MRRMSWITAKHRKWIHFLFKTWRNGTWMSIKTLVVIFKHFNSQPNVCHIQSMLFRSFKMNEIFGKWASHILRCCEHWVNFMNFKQWHVLSTSINSSVFLLSIFNSQRSWSFGRKNSQTNDQYQNKQSFFYAVGVCIVSCARCSYLYGDVACFYYVVRACVFVRVIKSHWLKLTYLKNHHSSWYLEVWH